jgi:hypothetical protein
MSIETKGTGVNCPGPIDAARLTDYWLGLLGETEETAIDEHLLGCDQCGARLREVIALAEGIGRVARQGSLRMVVSDAFLQRAVESGARVREYAPPPGGGVHCTVTADDDLVVGRLAADLSGITRLDLYSCDERGVEQFRLADIPFDPGAASVVWHESVTLMRAAPTMMLIARLMAFDDVGHERLLGEYTFHHTRSLPGPGAW